MMPLLAYDSAVCHEFGHSASRTTVLTKRNGTWTFTHSSMMIDLALGDPVYLGSMSGIKHHAGISIKDGHAQWYHYESRSRRALRSRVKNSTAATREREEDL